MNEATAIALILGLGIGAQWVAWRLRIPSILLLLLAGFLAGPVFHWIDPDALAGGLLMPLVSLSVAIILYEGGLNLKFAEIRETGRAVRNLVTVGALVSFVLAAVAARVCLGWPWDLSFLLGAILVVTGPTVVMPMLRFIRPSRQIASVLKWEGIVIDPIGAMLALLVFEAVRMIQLGEGSPALEVLTGFVRTAGVGTLFGALGAGLLVLLFSRFWVPDYLQNPFSLMVVVAVSTASDALQHESGLFAATLMGIILANQKAAKIRHIIEFKENLRVLLISTLFIVLAARITREQVEALPWGPAALFLACLILVVRPASVFLSTMNSALNRKERLFVASLAPRGIVAAAVASIFALGLESSGIGGPVNQLVPVVFFVIVGTVFFYSLTATPLARALGIAKGDQRGMLIVGAHQFARDLGTALSREGIDIILADTNRNNIAAARLAGLKGYYGNVLADDIEEHLDLTGIGRILAMTPNDEVNALATMHLKEHFGSAMLYQLPPADAAAGRSEPVPPHLQARLLFAEGLTFSEIARRYAEGHVLKKTQLTDTFTIDHFRERYGAGSIPLMLLTANERVRVFTTDDAPTPANGDRLLALVLPPDEPAEPGDRTIAPPASET